MNGGDGILGDFGKVSPPPEGGQRGVSPNYSTGSVPLTSFNCSRSSLASRLIDALTTATGFAVIKAINAINGRHRFYGERTNIMSQCWDSNPRNSSRGHQGGRSNPTATSAPLTRWRRAIYRACKVLLVVSIACVLAVRPVSRNCCATIGVNVEHYGNYSNTVPMHHSNPFFSSPPSGLGNSMSANDPREGIGALRPHSGETIGLSPTTN
ncbi:hypothetical protein RRG08_043077 [Elysia crispata]|uniref:Uncharacterized protein n=1 Tax=Elysia crispata TaxID=231223 RepID=A0AAE0XZJ7_9GAST|nr:hypothetical protein RRG08_043077 [Elysia crispata]